MAPAVDMAAPHNASTVKAENSKSLKVLDDLFGKLTISKTQDEVNAASQGIATFINGDIEEGQVPTKYVSPFSVRKPVSPRFVRTVANSIRSPR
jgi:elongation factor 3